jgi:hypothetical protein
LTHKPFLHNIIFYKMFSRISLALAMIVAAVLLMSNRSGVPQAVTLAPGEPANKTCNACHSGGNYDATIETTLLNLDSTVATTYVPNQKYIVRVSMAGKNNPKSFGFQMVALTKSDNKDMGKWSSLGPNVKNAEHLSRKYLVQSAPRADGKFYAQWTAPSTNLGPIKFYYSGLAVNLTGSTSGDSPMNGSLEVGAATTATADVSVAVPMYYDYMHRTIVSHDASIQLITIYDLNGRYVQRFHLVDQQASITTLSPGVYIAWARDKNGDQTSMRFIIME